MRVVSCFICVSAVMLYAGKAGAAPLTNPLTPDQVTCDELQLERIGRPLWQSLRDSREAGR